MPCLDSFNGTGAVDIFINSNRTAVSDCSKGIYRWDTDLRIKKDQLDSKVLINVSLWIIKKLFKIIAKLPV